MIRCRLGSWSRTLSKIYVTMTGRMDIGKINEKFENFPLSYITIDIDLKAKINDKYIKIESDDMNESKTRQIRFNLERIVPKSTEKYYLWILLAIMIGFILLTLISVFLVTVNMAIEMIFNCFIFFSFYSVDFFAENELRPKLLGGLIQEK